MNPIDYRELAKLGPLQRWRVLLHSVWPSLLILGFLVLVFAVSHAQAAIPKPIQISPEKTTNTIQCPEGYRTRQIIIGRLGEDGKLIPLGIVIVGEKC